MFVEEKEIGPGIVGNGDVGPAVVVEVGENHAHALGFRFPYTRGVADIAESSIVVVVE